MSIKRDESIDSEDSEASISEKYEKSIEIFAAHESDSSNDDSECESIGSIDEEIAEAVEKEFLARWSSFKDLKKKYSIQWHS